MSEYVIDLPTRVSGIPCLVRVLHYDRVEGSFSWHAASDMDYLGYTDCDWELLDQRGRRAPWLERKLDAATTDRICREIDEAMQ